MNEVDTCCEVARPNLEARDLVREQHSDVEHPKYNQGRFVETGGNVPRQYRIAWISCSEIRGRSH